MCRAPLDALCTVTGIDINVAIAAVSDLPQQALIQGNALFTHFKGAFTEQYVLNELIATGVSPSYWSTDEGMAEVEFVVQGATSIYPIEAKAERNLQAKILKSYRDRFAPRKCLRTSLSKRNAGEVVDDVPLYAVSTIAADYLGLASARATGSRP